MKEYVSLQAVLDIVMQYCPDDDGSCLKADRDIRDVLDEIEEISVTDILPIKILEHIKQRILETAFNNGGIYGEVAEDIADHIDTWVDEFGGTENDCVL